eukprot:CAMPEP_0179124918 /NCGR_PEP_ID=MMETSP0796-20121207/59055_1 /TAXON_ID=73915 /ORGANISM="Pyrodinium bahamense, Strain pbaha01" /LENGTH=733 /DNA_ID=CAMNT_0020823599 /DNA_START=79 /DNA_END=2281 /DNA_ORIENTATION=+
MPSFARPTQIALFAIAAVAACQLAAAAGVHRPSYDEWKGIKANKTAAVDAAVAKQKKMAAVDKVISLLEDLQTQVLAEGEKEAATYNEFACFCKDTTDEKTEAIQRGQDEMGFLDTEIESLEQQRGGLDTTIAGLLDGIRSEESLMQQAQDKRSKQNKVYSVNAADLQAALDALDGAIKSLNAQSVAALFLQQAPEVPTEDYKFHSDNIIATLEQLLKDFRAKKVEVDKAEVQSLHDFDQLMQEKKHSVKMKNAALDEAKERKAELKAAIAAASQRRTAVAALLLDDQEYLKNLAQICSDKAHTWDQRTKVRSEELQMLTQVIRIIKGAVSGNTAAGTVRFVQQGVTVRLAKAVAASETAMEAMEAEAEAVDASEEGTPFAFLQQEEAPRSFLARKHTEEAAAPKEQGRIAVAELLCQKGRDLKSTLLSALASKITADPFAKVKQLIQELIERLLQEAGNEANHKGWCDTSISDAEQKRDYTARKIQELNGQMARLEALRDGLEDELAILATEIGQLNDASAKAVSMRAEEKAENEKTIKEAQDGMNALDQAIDIVSKFYKIAAKEEVDLSFAQRGPAEDAPDAGFGTSVAYKGAQSEAVGILGMMEVMKSDFARTIMETEKAEAQAERDHLAFMTETGKSLAAKTEAEAAKSAQKRTAEDELSRAEEALGQQASLLETTVKELLELKPVCIDTGMTYQERVSRREDEIQALQKALCILKAYEQYGPEGTGEC